MKRYETAVAMVMARGVQRSSADPWLYRLLRRVGIPLRPPHFQGFGVLFALHAGLFGLGFVPAMLLLQRDADTIIVATAAVSGSIIFGIVMAGMSRHKVRQMDLPKWETI